MDFFYRLNDKGKRCAVQHPLDPLVMVKIGYLSFFSTTSPLAIAWAKPSVILAPFLRYPVYSESHK